MEFMQLIRPLLQNDQVMSLDEYKQHYKCNRLNHSMDVAYISYFLASVMRLDSGAVARAGLLHDLFFHQEDQGRARLLFSHPRIALENARKICSLSAKEEDIILKHMFLLTPWIPRYRESYLVTFVDKYCASRELIFSVFARRRIGMAIVYANAVPAKAA